MGSHRGMCVRNASLCHAYDAADEKEPSNRYARLMPARAVTLATRKATTRLRRATLGEVSAMARRIGPASTPVNLDASAPATARPVTTGHQGPCTRSAFPNAYTARVMK